MSFPVARIGALLLGALCGPLSTNAQVSGSVYLDADGDGVRDAQERGVSGVVVSNQLDVAITDANGAFSIAPGPGGIVMISVPDGYRAPRGFWRRQDGAALDFALARGPRVQQFRFVHASDPHIAPVVVGRTIRLRTLVDSLSPAFLLLTGDLVRDALRVNEAEARGYYDLLATQLALFRTPVFTVPGNHEVFGIERDKSGVDASHPLFGRAMYRAYRGPDYYSFTYGGVHFVGLNTVDIADQWYYGHVDSLQLAWLRRDLATIPGTMPVVTFNHIPLLTAVEAMHGYVDRPPAPTLITVGGTTQYRHIVANATELLSIVGANRYPLALGGHMHVEERLRYAGVRTRFHQAPAIVSASDGLGARLPSGVVLYRVRNGTIDEGTFIPLGARDSVPQ